MILDGFGRWAARQTVFSVTGNSYSEIIIAGFQTVEPKDIPSRLDADNFPTFFGWLDLENMLSRFGSLLV